MLTNFTSSSRLWSYVSDPDTSVHNSFSVYAETGEMFLNTVTNMLFFCTQGGTNQTWVQVTYFPQVLSAISTIPQSDWTQANNASSSYIQNKPALATVANTGNYSDLLGKPTIPSPQIQSDWTQANTLSLDYIKNKPASRSQTSASRSLNTIFQLSATRWSTVRYSVDISTTVSLSGGAVGRVVLEMATNSAFTTGVQELQSFGNGNTGTLVVGLALTQLTTACLSGDVPPGNYVRLRTVNTSGTPTFTYISGQETLV